MVGPNAVRISVIIPVYHIPEHYLQRCLSSLKAQSFTLWEAIIIDDGNSPDYAQMLDSYNDLQIRVFHQVNKGVSASRNFGMNVAGGEWIIFLDPDDLLPRNALEWMITAAESEQADVVITGYQEIKIDDTVFEPDLVFDDIVCFYVAAQDAVKEVIARGYCIRHKKPHIQDCLALVFPWGHLYSRSMLEGIRFPIDLHPGEDKIFNLYVYDVAEKIVVLPAPLYGYRVNVGVTSVYRKKTLLNCRLTWQYMMGFIDQKLTSVDRQMINKSKMDEIAYLATQFFFHRDNPDGLWGRLQAFKAYLQDAHCKEAVHDLRNPYYTRKQRILALAICLALLV